MSESDKEIGRERRREIEGRERGGREKRGGREGEGGRESKGGGATS